MPIRIQATRPYYPRLYLPHPRATAAPAVSRGGRGTVGPGGIDTTPTGNVGADIVKAINATIQQNRQNAVANQILNTQTPARAAAVTNAQGQPIQRIGGVDVPVNNMLMRQGGQDVTYTPPSGVSLLGTSPQTGGVSELQMRQQQNQADLANALEQAKIKATLALAAQRTGGGAGGGGGNAARWKDYLGDGGGDGGAGTKKSGKQPPYRTGDIDPLTDPKADNFQYVQTDFDARYGKGAYAKIAPNLANATVDDKGNYNITDSKGNPVMTLPADQANYWLARYNAASVKAGQQPIFTDKFPSANPNSGQPAGSQTNPYKPRNLLEARSLPNGSYLIHPDTGQVGLKGAEAKEPPSSEKTSQADTGKVADTSDSDQDLKDEDQQDQEAGTDDQASRAGAQQPVQVAKLMPANTPGAFDLGTSATGGLPADQDTSLADAIAKAKAAQSLQGVV